MYVPCPNRQINIMHVFCMNNKIEYVNNISAKKMEQKIK